MTIKKIDIDGREIMFINNSRNTRSGFAHDTTLFIDNREMEHATCHYLNRTWECYQYQSVMKAAVRKYMDRLTENARKQFMDKNGYRKLNAQRLQAFREYIDNNNYISFIYKIWEALQ